MVTCVVVEYIVYEIINFAHVQLKAEGNKKYVYLSS